MLKLKDRERIVFAGDSVTDAGRAYPVGDGPNGLGSGFVRAIDTMLNAFYPQFMFDIINAGINGNTTRDLLARWDRDVIALKPDRLVICIGINDVWRQFDYPCNPDRHVLPEEYEANMRKLIESAKESVPEILLLTPYYMEPNAADTMRARMDEYGAIVKRLAKEYSLPCIDLSARVQRVSRQPSLSISDVGSRTSRPRRLDAHRGKDTEGIRLRQGYHGVILQ